MPRLRIAFIAIFLGAVLVWAACSRGEAPQSASALPSPDLSPTLPASATPASSLPPPVSPTPTLSPTATPRPAVTPQITPTGPITPTATMPPPVQAIDIPPQVEVMVLLGSDNFAPYAGRSDSILLVFFNPQNGNASLLSVPRDLYVYQPGVGMQRINSAYVSGGIELLYQTLEYNLGVRPRHWALAHLDDFIHFVDDLGGIKVYVTHPLPDDCGGIPEGDFHMDGATALCYVRERNTSSDIHRSLRQQEVLRVIFDRFMSLDNIPRLPNWYRRYSSTVQTDMTLSDLLSLVPFAVRHYQGGSLHHFQIGFEDVVGWRVPETNAAVLLPRREKILPKIQQAVDVLLPPVAAVDLTATPTPDLEPEGMAVDGQAPLPDEAALTDPEASGSP